MAKDIKKEVQGETQPLSAMANVKIAHAEFYHPVKLINGVFHSFDSTLGHTMEYNPNTQLIELSYSRGEKVYEALIPVSNCAWMSKLD